MRFGSEQKDFAFLGPCSLTYFQTAVASMPTLRKRLRILEAMTRDASLRRRVGDKARGAADGM